MTKQLVLLEFHRCSGDGFQTFSFPPQEPQIETWRLGCLNECPTLTRTTLRQEYKVSTGKTSREPNPTGSVQSGVTRTAAPHHCCVSVLTVTVSDYSQMCSLVVVTACLKQRPLHILFYDVTVMQLLSFSQCQLVHRSVTSSTVYK